MRITIVIGVMMAISKSRRVKTRVFALELTDDLAYRLLGIKVNDLTAKKQYF